jgi:soluble lytic murein transglycosylase-like protein
MASVTRLMRGALVAATVFAAVTCQAELALAQEAAIPSPLEHWQGFIAEASHRFGIPEAWIRAVIRDESGGQTMLDGRPITSRAGAIGLMQIMPETWAELRTRYGLGNNPYDPRDNILAGTAYLRELYKRYGYPNLFAAYNAGPARFDAHLFGGQPLPKETLAYLAALGQPVFEPAKSPPIPSGTSLFFPLVGNPDMVSSPSSTASSHGLFVPLMTAFRPR